MNQMTLISRRTPSVRCEDWGRDRPRAQVPIWTFTETERQKNAQIEDDMIASMKPRKKTVTEELFGDSRSNEQRQEDNRAAILAHLDVPRTAKEIADRMGRGQETVATSLRRMKELGTVDCVEQPRGEDGRPVGRLWSKTIAPHVRSNLEKGRAKREALFALIDGPQTVRELAERMGLRITNVRDMLAVLEQDGRVKKAGKTAKVHHGGIASLWVRA